MGIHAKVWKEEVFHLDGSLKYECTWAILTEEGAKLAKRSVTAADGTERIRIGVHRKLHSTGVVAWELYHDDLGEVISSAKQKRADGSPVHA